MPEKTPLHPIHVASGAAMVDFGGWEMPLHYGSQIQEHHAVRRGAGMFDVSHMRVVDFGGPGAHDWLRRIVANDVAKLVPGKALYGCMLNEHGGVIDDLIVYSLGAGRYRAVVNAGTAEKDLAWMRKTAAAAAAAVEIACPPAVAMIAVQGPRACELLGFALPEAAAAIMALKPFSAMTAGACFIARTGYTGEDGCEVVLPSAAAATIWNALREAGVTPCGLGARDTLRLEAGMNLYGQDMDETVSPLESGLAWTVDFGASRDFVGRAALDEQIRRGGLREMVGLVLLDKGVIRSHYGVETKLGRGEVTSGTFSPTLGRSIALARVPAGVTPGMDASVDLRGRAARARVVKPPFVRIGKSLVEKAIGG